MKKISAIKFIEKMGEEGNWNGVLAVGNTAGFDFTKSELITALPKGFFKGNGQNPEFGWDTSTVND